jgi:hypothetical protein
MKRRIAIVVHGRFYAFDLGRVLLARDFEEAVEQRRSQLVAQLAGAKN